MIARHFTRQGGVLQYGEALQYASPHLDGDWEIVLKAVKQNTLAYADCGLEKLKIDCKIVLTVLKYDKVPNQLVLMKELFMD
jgi:hypothetical protein